MAWLGLGIIIWAALMFLVTPLLKKNPEQSENSHEIRAYKDEITRLEAEIDAGGEPELETRKIDLQRQLLSLTQNTDANSKAPSYLIINSLFAFFVFGGIGLYSLLGSPDLTKAGALKPSTAAPAQERPQSANSQAADRSSLGDLVGQLKSNLDGERKNDPDGWMLYARTLMSLRRFEEAFESYDQALALTDNSPLILDELKRARDFAAQSLTAGAASRGPSAEDVKEAANMSTEDRAAMIENMVSGLASRLKDNPNNPEGWERLIRARKVLGQTEQAKADVAAMKQTFAKDPELAAQILARAGWTE